MVTNGVVATVTQISGSGLWLSNCARSLSNCVVVPCNWLHWAVVRCSHAHRVGVSFPTVVDWDSPPKAVIRRSSSGLLLPRVVELCVPDSTSDMVYSTCMSGGTVVSVSPRFLSAGSWRGSPTSGDHRVYVEADMIVATVCVHSCSFPGTCCPSLTAESSDCVFPGDQSG